MTTIRKGSLNKKVTKLTKLSYTPKDNTPNWLTLFEWRVHPVSDLSRQVDTNEPAIVKPIIQGCPKTITLMNYEENKTLIRSMAFNGDYLEDFHSSKFPNMRVVVTSVPFNKQSDVLPDPSPETSMEKNTAAIAGELVGFVNKCTDLMVTPEEYTKVFETRRNVYKELLGADTPKLLPSDVTIVANDEVPLEKRLPGFNYFIDPKLKVKFMIIVGAVGCIHIVDMVPNIFLKCGFSFMSGSCMTTDSLEDIKDFMTWMMLDAL